MWIIPRNYRHSSHFVRDMVESKEDLSLPGLDIESSLMSRSKPSLLRTWLVRWNRGGYIRPLFGRILKPSRWTAFEAELTSSLAVIRVSHSAQRDSEKEKTTQDTSGLIFSTSSKQLDLFDASSKTSKDTYLSDSEKSSKTWKSLAIKRRGEYSRRVKSAHRIIESGSLLWPTPAARDYKGAVLPETLAAKNRNPMTNSLPDAIQHKSGSGRLNPAWVEWLMGVPTGWTELGCWGTE